MLEESDMQARIEALEARLSQVEAHQAILNLKSEYGALADARYTRQGPKSQAEIDEIAVHAAGESRASESVADSSSDFE